MNTKFFTHLVFIGLLSFSSVALASPIEQQRSDFLQAESAINQGNDLGFFQLSANITDYPLYPYLQYQWLNKHLAESEKIQAFLNNYSNSRYALLLRTKWLSYLAEQQRWLEFVQNYQPNDDVGLQCQFHWAAYQATQTAQSINEAKRLWLTGEELPKQCDSLLAILLASPVMTPELIWQRFTLALVKDEVGLANHLQKLMPASEQARADLWLQIHKNPTLITQLKTLEAPLFAHGVIRLAKSQLETAIGVWDNNKQVINPDQETLQRVERELGMALARKRDSRAYDRLNLVMNPDEEVREWKVRAALLAQNWQQVNNALAGLSTEEHQQPKWLYWQARALTETGDTLGAQAIWAKLAQDRSFYGFVAADIINQPYSTSNKPVQVSDNELLNLANETDFKVAQELRVLNRDLEAKRQWTYSIKKLPKEKLLLAAKLAQYWQWHPIAIITMVQADYWDDLTVRFPTSYSQQVQAYASLQQLDPALVFGLMRQESMLDQHAESSAGAKGLMQLMPDTARQVARKLNEPWQGTASLFNPDINIKYGSFYYKQLLNRFNGHFALATAAYNAGPERVDKWMPTGTMPIDVWIETIPFKETRKYVTSVFSYTLIYSQLLQQNKLKITNLLPPLPSG